MEPDREAAPSPTYNEHVRNFCRCGLAAFTARGAGIAKQFALLNLYFNALFHPLTANIRAGELPYCAILARLFGAVMARR